jgi:hypothetical protein
MMVVFHDGFLEKQKPGAVAGLVLENVEMGAWLVG